MKSSYLKTVALSATLALALGRTTVSFLRSDSIVLAANLPRPVPADGDTIEVDTEFDSQGRETQITTETISPSRVEEITEVRTYDNTGNFTSAWTNDTKVYENSTDAGVERYVVIHISSTNNVV